MAGGKPWQAVQLPHDAMIGGERDPERPLGQRLLPRRRLGVREDLRRARGAAREERAARVRRRVPQRVGVDERCAGRSPTVRIHRASPSRSADTCGTARTTSIEGAGDVARRRPVVFGRWDLPARAPRRRRAGAPRARRRDVTTPQVDDDGALVEVATVVESNACVTTTTTVTTEIVDDAGAVVARDVAAAHHVPRPAETLRQRLFVAQPRRWSVDHRPCTRAAPGSSPTAIELDARATRPSGSARWRSTRNGACASTANPSCCGARASTTTTARSAPRPSPGPTSAGSRSCKAAGFNALRSAHHPMSRAMLDACDRIGMLVMDEAFDVWTESKMDDDYAQAFPEWWPADVEAMVRKDRNHPSVIMYSIGNEIPDVRTPSGAALGRAITERIRALDDTRLVTNSINPLLASAVPSCSRRSARRAPSVDPDRDRHQHDDDDDGPVPPPHAAGRDRRRAHRGVVLLPRRRRYNYTESRFVLDHELHPQRVIVGSENRPADDRGELAAGARAPARDRRFHLDRLGLPRRGRHRAVRTDRTRRTRSAASWRRTRGSRPIRRHRHHRVRRPVSYWRETVCGLRDTPYLAVRPPGHHGEESSFRAGWSFTDAIATWSWDGFEGKPVTVEVYADADDVELLVNGGRSAGPPRGRSSAISPRFDTTYKSGVLTAVASRGGAEIGRVTLSSARGPVLLDVQVDRASHRRHGSRSRVCRRHAGRRRWQPAQQQRPRGDRLGSRARGPPGIRERQPVHRETFGAPTHHTYNGRALAVIRPTGAGTITVKVSAEGATTAP